MTLFSGHELDAVTEAATVANTPGSLFAWLERSPAVQRVVEQYNEDAILDALTGALSLEPRTEVTIALAYAYLVAIVILRRRFGNLGTPPIQPEVLQWGPAIWRRAQRATPSSSTQSVDLTIPPTVEVGDPESSKQGKTQILNSTGNPIMRTEN